VERSRSALAEADLVLFVLNYGEPLHEEEVRLFEELSGRDMIVIVNKTDLAGKLDIDDLRQRFAVRHIVPMSVKEQRGLDDLEKAIADLFFSGELEPGDMTYVSNVRHIQLLKKARASLTEAADAAEAMMPVDMVQIDIRNAWEALGEIIGDSVSESLIDQIFSQFCLGK